MLTVTEVKAQINLFKDPKTIKSWVSEHKDNLSQVCIAYANYRIYSLSPKKKVVKKEPELVEIFDGKLFPGEMELI